MSRRCQALEEEVRLPTRDRAQQVGAYAQTIEVMKLEKLCPVSATASRHAISSGVLGVHHVLAVPHRQYDAGLF